MAETMGSLIDKICIAELKIFHIQEQIDRQDVDENHRQLCRSRLAVMQTQRSDLAAELNEFVERWKLGNWMPKVYRQFKMYNDPKFRVAKP